MRNHENYGRPPSDAVPPGRYVFCGTEEHRSSPLFESTTLDVVSTSPPTYHRASFLNHGDMLNWCAQINYIRARIRNINEDRDAGRISEIRRKHLLRLGWLQSIYSLVAEWGAERVPTDIRWACNDVCVFLNIPPLNFPDLIEINYN